MKLNKKIIKYLLGSLQSTHGNEIACDACFEQLHNFVELELTGKTPEHAMPLVKDHMAKCGECRQEYEALLEAIKELEVYS